MSNRQSVNYNLLTNQSANGTSIKKINVQDFRHIGITISTSAVAFTGSIKIKGSRTDKGEDIDFTVTSTQVNKWSYLQLINNESGTTINGGTGLTLTAISNGVYDLAVNVDSFNWISVEISGYTAGDVTVDAILYNNQ